MIRHCLAAVVLLLAPVAAMSQRYGRPYSLADNPQLILEVKVENEHRYFKLSDLRKMQRSTVTIADPVTGTSHVLEGVALERLVPNAAWNAPGESIEIEFGADKTLTIAAKDLDPQTKLIVVDTVDGKPLSGTAPYYLVTKPRSRPEQAIAHVRCITLKAGGTSAH
jgi:hypothetical protein